MKYYEFTFTLTPSSTDAQDLLSGMLAEVGFDSFVPTESGCNPLLAYILQDNYDHTALQTALENFPMPHLGINYSFTEAEDKDWNEEWEKNYFQPLIITDRCVIASTFHKDIPQAEYRIFINPRMSFGTGHHATTSQMLTEILDSNLMGKRVLDMGCGTSILAILARLKGAKEVLAVDYDEWCVENSKENIALNKLDQIEVRLGDASALDGEQPFDLILANINRNILIQDIPQYISIMRKGSELIVSGFFIDDAQVITNVAQHHGLRLIRQHDSDRWACLAFEKE